MWLVLNAADTARVLFGARAPALTRAGVLVFPRLVSLDCLAEMESDITPERRIQRVFRSQNGSYYHGNSMPRKDA